jgi:hypothetical protein
MSEKIYLVPDADKQAIVGAGCRVIDAHGVTWVQFDVYQAIMTYRKMGGYAGLTLVEYLVKMGLGNDDAA